MIYTTLDIRQKLLDAMGPECKTVIEDNISSVPLFDDKCPVIMTGIEQHFIQKICAPGEEKWECHGDCAWHWISFLKGETDV